MRSLISGVGWVCLAVPVCIGLALAPLLWIFRDGIGPGVIPSTGLVALSRAYGGYIWFLPFVTFGLICIWISRRLRSRTRNDNPDEIDEIT
jgi:hypothetical protein